MTEYETFAVFGSLGVVYLSLGIYLGHQRRRMIREFNDKMGLIIKRIREENNYLSRVRSEPSELEGNLPN